MKPGEIFKLTREGRQPAIKSRIGEIDVAPGAPTPIRAEPITEPLDQFNAAQVLTELYDLRLARGLIASKDYMRYTELAAKAPRSRTEEAELERLAQALRVRLPSAAEAREAREAYAMIQELFRERLRVMAADKRDPLLAEVAVQLQELANGSRRPE